MNLVVGPGDLNDWTFLYEALLNGDAVEENMACAFPKIQHSPFSSEEQACVRLWRRGKCRLPGGDKRLSEIRNPSADLPRTTFERIGGPKGKIHTARLLSLLEIDEKVNPVVECEVISKVYHSF